MTTLAQDRAAAWITHEVNSAAIVACDPLMCRELEASGLPAARLLVLPPATPAALGAEVIVATPTVRKQFGARLTTVYAPLVIASFGSGVGRIDIRAVAPTGAAAFEAALAAYRRERIAAGQLLLHNERVRVSASARGALSTGMVDSRLLVTLAALAARLPVRVVAFSDASPGADPAVPLRAVEIRAGPQADVPVLFAFLAAQRVPYLPSQVRIGRGVGDQLVLDVAFDAPSPLGLIATPVASG
jgi:hypothetical protein